MNEGELLDRLLRRKMRWQRYAKGLARDYGDQIAVSDGKTLPMIHALLEDMTGRDKKAYLLNGHTKRADRLRELLKRMQKAHHEQLATGMRVGFGEARDTEYKLTANDLIEAGEIKVKRGAKTPAIILGATVAETAASSSSRLYSRLVSVVKGGITDEAKPGEIFSRIRGTTSLKGVVQARNSGAVSHIENAVNTGVYRGHDEIFRDQEMYDVRWLATLDGRTCVVCASLDGEKFDSRHPHKKPLAHPRCRCDIVPNFTDGTRPYLKAFKPVAELPETGKELRDAGKLGNVSAKVNYPEWFGRQSAAFQREWLGPSRYELYKNGGYTIDQFADPLKSKVLTLEEI